MLSRETYIITSTVRANQIQNIKIACDGKKIVVETIEDAVPKETHTGIEVTTKAAAAIKAAVDTEVISIPKATTTEAVVVVMKEPKQMPLNLFLLRRLLKHLRQQ